jgi:hypothetical protein
MVQSQGLLILGGVEQGDVTRFFQLVHGIFEEDFVLWLIERFDPRCPILQVSGEDGLGSIDPLLYSVLSLGSRGPQGVLLSTGV